MNIVALAGGVGGAKLADGLQRVVGESLTVIVNTGDDFELHGLRISPDLDTVMYTLAGIANPETGWGIAGDTFACLDMIARYGADDWFGLGDRDLAADVLRTYWVRAGQTLTQVTARLAAALGVRPAIRPMTDSRVATFVDTDQGELAFQEYFVHRGWQPVVKSMRFAGVETAQPTLEVLQAMARADAIVFCPSNPFVSIDPILAVQGMRGAISQARVPRVAVSPIVSGDALRGPAAKMFRELGLEPSALAVAMRYEGLIDAFVVDKTDEAQAESIQALGIRTLVTATVMKTDADRGRLAKEIVNWVTGSLDR